MLKRYTCVMQHDASDCAPASIATVLLRYKQEISISKLREIIGTDLYGSRPPVIQNLNLIIPKGKKIAIVGESGAGKSTLAKILMKFVENDTGKITINGYDLKDIDASYLRKNVAYIPQKIELFTGSIIDNLKVGNPEAKYEEILSACQKAGANGFIERLPNRYHSFVEEGGSNFSGGEKQRLAIARAILAKSKIFIFDEATSNLDSFSEKKIHNLLFNRIQDSTTIIIAHRLSTIISCDIICFMENGRIVEKGTHQELMRVNGKYAKMIRLQHISIERAEQKYVKEEEINYG